MVSAWSNGVWHTNMGKLLRSCLQGVLLPARLACGDAHISLRALWAPSARSQVP